jgi:DNA-binding transcriptional MerR regulator
MHPDTDTFELTELADRAGVSIRTVRYYIQQGLLPSPETRGPGTRYGREHLDRLRLVKRLQREHLPLAEIRRRLEAMDDAEIRRLAEGEMDAEPAPRSSASEYIRRVLSDGPSKIVRERMPAAPRRSIVQPDALAPVAESALGGRAPQRSQWDRFVLAPDIELHVRRPLTREQNRQVERLMEAARRILEEEVS